MRVLRFILFPFSLLYSIITWLRNIAFDLGFLPTYHPKVKCVCVGNLSTGGTGKTPMTELLIREYAGKYNTAVLSRGYGRKTKGMRLVEVGDDAKDSGDEALQIKRKFPEVLVMVSEKRVPAVKEIEKNHPEIQLVILDDAFQHRYLSPQFNILLTTYSSPYHKDFVLPSGDLRESRSGSKRADVIVVTKSPADLHPDKQSAFVKKMSVESIQKVFFASNEYSEPELVAGDQVEEEVNCVLVSGIADNRLLLEKVTNMYPIVDVLKYSDHHDYSEDDVRHIIHTVKENDAGDAFLLMTEKDWVKLKNFKDKLSVVSTYVLPYRTVINDKEALLAILEQRLFNE